MITKEFPTFLSAFHSADCVNMAGFRVRVVAIKPYDKDKERIPGSWDVMENRGSYFIRVGEELWEIFSADRIEVRIF